jgi:glycosyltransferase involved in cell wall biosynthesis
LRLTFVQYAGDYRDAFERLERGGQETYHAQRYSVNVVGELAQKLEQVCFVCAVTETRYDTLLGNGVRAIGAGLRHGFKGADLVREVAKSKPTGLSLTTPNLSVLKWGHTNKIPTIAILADSFQYGGLRSLVRNRLLAYYLNKSTVDWIGNHGINACLSLEKIGVRPQKIVPWDWPHIRSPSYNTSKTLRQGPSWKIVYVGSVAPAKGVSDVLNALALLKAIGIHVSLSIVGSEPDSAMRQLAETLDILATTEFVGLVDNKHVPRLMREADLVIIPSRHEYPEGLPLTIYEALSARTPIVASDHPMFRNVLVDQESALIFPAGDAEKLAAAIERLLGDPELYARLSLGSEEAWNAIQLPVQMGNLLEAWLSNDRTRLDWLKAHTLNSGRYDNFIQR